MGGEWCGGDFLIVFCLSGLGHCFAVFFFNLGGGVGMVCRQMKPVTLEPHLLGAVLFFDVLTKSIM